MISMLISILILFLIFGVVGWIITLIPLPQRLKEVALVVVALIFVLIVMSYLVPIYSVPHWR